MTDMTEPIMLTQQDHAILKRMLDECANTDDLLASALRRKLAGARIVPPETIAPDVVTISSRVAFRVDGGEEQTRVIVHEDRRLMTGLTLPLAHPRSIAMLGLRAGCRAFVGFQDGRTETVTVVRISYQPEAARRETAIVVPAVAPKRTVPRVLRADNDCEEPAAG